MSLRTQWATLGRLRGLQPARTACKQVLTDNEHIHLERWGSWCCARRHDLERQETLRKTLPVQP